MPSICVPLPQFLPHFDTGLVLGNGPSVQTQTKLKSILGPCLLNSMGDKKTFCGTPYHKWHRIKQQIMYALMAKWTNTV